MSNPKEVWQIAEHEYEMALMERFMYNCTRYAGDDSKSLMYCRDARATPTIEARIVVAYHKWYESLALANIRPPWEEKI